MPKTEAERRDILVAAGLDPDAPALVRPVAKQPLIVAWAPEGVDPHKMPVTDIVFTPQMVEHFPDLSPKSRKAAYNHLFEQYKGIRGDKDRNSLLGRLINSFLASEYHRRNPGGGYVRDKMRLANDLATHDIKPEDLAEFLAWKESRGE